MSTPLSDHVVGCEKCAWEGRLGDFQKHPCGVAAPLEPLEIAAQKIAEHMGCCVDDIDLVRDILNEFAAAVSKNLQVSLHCCRRNRDHFEEMAANSQARILKLEKEIAALRDTK